MNAFIADVLKKEEERKQPTVILCTVQAGFHLNASFFKSLVWQLKT